MKSSDIHGSHFHPEFSAKKSCCENNAKLTEKHLCQDLYFNNAGGSRPGRIQRGFQDIVYCIGNNMETIPNVFSYVHQQFFRMPDLWRQKG